MKHPVLEGDIVFSWVGGSFDKMDEKVLEQEGFLPCQTPTFSVRLKVKLS